MKPATIAAILASAVTFSAATFSGRAFADVLPPTDAGDAAAATSDGGLPATTRVDSGTAVVQEEKGGCSFAGRPAGRGAVALLIAGAVLFARRRRPVA